MMKKIRFLSPFCGLVLVISIAGVSTSDGHEYRVDYDQPTASVVRQELEATEFYLTHSHAPAPIPEKKYRRRSVSLLGWEFSVRRDPKKK